MSEVRSTNRVLTVEEAAALLRVSERTVRALLHQGKLPGRKLGREWRSPELQLMNWLASDTFQPPAMPPLWSPEERAARVDAILGSMAHVPRAVESPEAQSVRVAALVGKYAHARQR